MKQHANGTLVVDLNVPPIPEELSQHPWSEIKEIHFDIPGLSGTCLVKEFRGLRKIVFKPSTKREATK